MDGPKIEQALANLVSNAVEHGRREVTVTVSRAPGDAVAFSVADDGPGIPEEDMGKLFKPFGTTGARKTGGEKSTGLGLLITRKIIEAHGGAVRVERPPGGGTAVRFTLPVRRPGASGESLPPPP